MSEAWTRDRATEGHVVTDDGARLYYRTVGDGRPVVVLHGGPDFDHHYLVPELDRLAGSLRLIYYDQRGRGRSAAAGAADTVTLASEIEDLDAVRRWLGPGPVSLLGHSWGSLLALEYAARYCDRVSHLVLVNTAPASGADALRLREHLLRIRPPEVTARMRELASWPAFQAGDRDAEAEYYRLHFASALARPEHVGQVVARLRVHFDEAATVAARTIEERLYQETWSSGGYDPLPRLRDLYVPTLVVHGDHDFVPVPLAARIAEALPRARLVVLEQCGHFAYLEQPEPFAEVVTAFFASQEPRGTS